MHCFTILVLLPSGRMYNKDGNLVQWWKPEIIDNFKEKAQCIVDQYGRYVVPEANLTVRHYFVYLSVVKHLRFKLPTRLVNLEQRCVQLSMDSVCKFGPWAWHTFTVTISVEAIMSKAIHRPPLLLLVQLHAENRLIHFRNREGGFG